MTWGPNDCGPDGFTPDGAPCVPDTNTPPATPPPGGGTTPGGCDAGTVPHPQDPRICIPEGRPIEEAGGEYQPPEFGGSSRPNFSYRPPPPFNATRFKPTTLQDMLADPGYQFGFDEGTRALQQSAASKGLTRTGGTLKDLIAWGGNYATQRFDSVNNRRLQDYDRLFRAESAEYAPQYGGWQTQMAMGQRESELAFRREWEQYLAQLEDERFWAELGLR
jgi:hypothetical protein